MFNFFPWKKNKKAMLAPSPAPVPAPIVKKTPYSPGFKIHPIEWVDGKTGQNLWGYVAIDEAKYDAFVEKVGPYARCMHTIPFPCSLEDYGGRYLRADAGYPSEECRALMEMTHHRDKGSVMLLTYYSFDYREDCWDYFFVFNKNKERFLQQDGLKALSKTYGVSLATGVGTIPQTVKDEIKLLYDYDTFPHKARRLRLHEQKVVTQQEPIAPIVTKPQEIPKKPWETSPELRKLFEEAYRETDPVYRPVYEQPSQYPTTYYNVLRGEFRAVFDGMVYVNGQPAGYMDNAPYKGAGSQIYTSDGYGIYKKPGLY